MRTDLKMEYEVAQRHVGATDASPGTPRPVSAMCTLSVLSEVDAGSGADGRASVRGQMSSASSFTFVQVPFSRWYLSPFGFRYD